MDEPQFAITLFYGIYRLERIGYTRSQDYIYAYFEIKRTNIPLDAIPPEIADHIPTMLELYAMLQKGYLAEFLMSIGINCNYMPRTKEVILNVFQDEDSDNDDEAYISLQGKFSSNLLIPQIHDTLLSGEPVTQVVSIGQGLQMVITNQMYYASTQPYAMREVDMAVSSIHGETEFPGWTSRGLDFIQIYENYIKPLIYGMIGNILELENPYKNIPDVTKYEDYYKSSVIFNISYDKYTFHCTMYYLPDEVLGHLINWWGGDSPFNIQVSQDPMSNAKYGTALDEDELRLVLGTAWSGLYPINLSNVQKTWANGRNMIILDLLEPYALEHYPNHDSCNLIGLPNGFYTNLDHYNQVSPMNVELLNQKRQFNISDNNGQVKSVMATETPYIFTLDGILLSACTPFSNFDSCGGYVALRFDQDLTPDQMHHVMSDEEVKVTFPELYDILITTFHLDKKRLKIMLLPFVSLPRARKYLIFYNYMESVIKENEQPKEQEGIIPKESTPKKKPSKKTGFFKDRFKNTKK